MKLKRMDILDEQQVHPKIFGGVDWDVPLKVLAVKGKKELWWRKGFTGWICQGQSGYYPGILYLADLDVRKYDIPKTTELQEGGRLGRPMFERHAKEIDTFFGVSVAEHLHPRKTVKL